MYGMYLVNWRDVGSTYVGTVGAVYVHMIQTPTMTTTIITSSTLEADTNISPLHLPCRPHGDAQYGSTCCRRCRWRS